MQIVLHTYDHISVTKDDSMYFHCSEWHYSMSSYPIRRVWLTDGCVTENKQYWKQKITDTFLFIETKWQRKTCRLDFIPSVNNCINSEKVTQRQTEAEQRSAQNRNTSSSWKDKNLLSKLTVKKRKFNNTTGIMMNNCLFHLHAPPSDI